MGILPSPRRVAKRGGTAADSAARQKGVAKGREYDGGGSENHPSPRSARRGSRRGAEGGESLAEGWHGRGGREMERGGNPSQAHGGMPRWGATTARMRSGP